MSTGYPFSTLVGNNVLDQILSPKIVGSAVSGYQVKLDLGNIDTLYATDIGTATNRVSDIYGVTLHYQFLDPPITGGGGGGTTGATGPIGPTGPGGTGPAGPTGPRGDTGFSVTVTVDEEITTLPPGSTGYVFNDSTTASNVNLVFGLPRGATGPPGPPGSGSQIIQGPIGNVLFFGATGVTSDNTLNFSSGALTVPTEIVTQPTNDGQMRLTTNLGTSFLQSGSKSNVNNGNVLSIGRLYAGTDFSTVEVNTQSFQVAIGQGNTPTGSPEGQTLDVHGLTVLHADPGDSKSGGTFGAPIIVTTPTSVGTALPAATYRIYAWGEGGTGPNALAGGSIQFDVTVPSGGQQLTYGITGAGPTTGPPGYTGGNGLFVTLGASTYWAYGGGGGSSVTSGGAGTSAAGATPGQGGSVSSGAGGTGGLFEFAAGGGTYIFNGNPAGSTFTTALTTPGFFNFPTGTTFTFPTLIPVQNQFVNIPMPANSTIRIDLPTGGNASLVGTASISGTPIPGVGTQYYATTSVNNVPLVIPSGSTGVTGIAVSGNGQGETAGANINVTGSSIQVVSRASPTLSTSSATVQGDSSVFYPTAGTISFGTTGAIEYAGTTIVLTEPMRVDFGPGALTADTITAVISQTIAIGFPNYGSISIAGSGTSVRGGLGINGGGGGGGYFGGGGGNENIGGNGSSFLPPGTVKGVDNTRFPSTIPYGNQFGTYGAPRVAGGSIVIELRTVSTLALGVTGDVAITGSETVGGGLTVTGSETVGGGLTVTGSIQGNSNIQTLSNLLVNGGIYGANSTTLPSLPLGLTSGPITSGGPSTFGSINLSGGSSQNLFCPMPSLQTLANVNINGRLSFPVIGTSLASLVLAPASTLPTLNTPSGFSGYFTTGAGVQDYIVQPPTGYYVGPSTLLFITPGNGSASTRMSTLSPTATIGTDPTNCGYFRITDVNTNPAPLFQYFWLNLLY